MNIKFNDIVFKNNTASLLSLVYITDNAIATFNRGVFSDNIGLGASEFIIKDCDAWVVTITNSTASRLTRNSQALSSGSYRENWIDIVESGELHLININFTNYQNTSIGPIIYGIQSQIYIHGWQFINNSADTGGVISISSDIILSISDSTFDSNIAFISSGWIDASFGCNITSQNNIFKNNYAGIQGIFTIMTNSYFIDSGSTYQNNTANSEYSIGYANDLYQLSFTGSTFIKNIWNNGSALLYIAFSSIVVDQWIFVNNTYSINGTIINAMISDISVRGSSFNWFVTNEIYESQGVSLILANANLANNIFKNWQAELGGGLIFIGSNIISQNDLFTDNIGFSQGGAIYGVYHSTASFSNGTFNNNQSPEGSAIYISEIMSYIYISKSQFYSQNSTQFIGGFVCSFNIDNSSFSSTIYQSSSDPTNDFIGTAIYVTSIDRLKLTNSQFVNISSNHGVVYISNSITGISYKSIYSGIQILEP